MQIRNAQSADLDALARLWFDGWQEAHAPILPAELARHRTLESFRARLASALHEVRVMGEAGQPLGMVFLKDDELYQLYVSAAARGSGAALELLDDGERTLAERGVETAWLACAIGNDRATRFYEKHGWRRAGALDYEAYTSEGVFALKVWRYEKVLTDKR